MKWWDSVKRKPFFIRTFNWEYWPTFALYWPFIVYGPLLALRSRHLCFFSAANPGIFTSGFGMESKYETILKIPEALRPKTVFAGAGEDFENVRKKIADAGIDYPLIAKPDIGYRGLLVRKIDHEEELKAYLNQYPINFIIQEFVKKPEEIGILYYRFPDADKGRITSITLKEFLFVTGDGHSTVLELVLQKPRAVLQLDRLRQTHANVLETIPDQGERVALGVVGNHAKGTVFLNGNQFIDARITETFDRISRQIEGVYYGRFDVKCDSLEALRRGEGLKIIEINGICSEPAHIYQPGASYFRALWELMRHWEILRRVSLANHKLGAPYMKLEDVVKAFRELHDYVRLIQEVESD